MNVVLRFCVVDDATGRIVQTLERLGAPAHETIAEIQANVTAARGPGYTVIELCRHDGCELVSPELARWDAAQGQFVPRGRVVSVETRQFMRDELLATGNSPQEADRVVAERASWEEGLPVRHLAKVHLAGEGPEAS